GVRSEQHAVVDTDTETISHKPTFLFVRVPGHLNTNMKSLDTVLPASITIKFFTRLAQKLLYSLFEY
ncbi:MAG: hypothetical protein AB2700_14910, partial [Candidatus Thiodiazotropha taylori]